MPLFTGSANTTTAKLEVVIFHVAEQLQVEKKFQRLYRCLDESMFDLMALTPMFHDVPVYRKYE